MEARKTIDSIEVCMLYQVDESEIEGVNEKGYFVRFVFDWKNVLGFSESFEFKDCINILLICGDVCSVQLDFYYCFKRFKDVNTFNFINLN